MDVHDVLGVLRLLPVLEVLQVVQERRVVEVPVDGEDWAAADASAPPQRSAHQEEADKQEEKSAHSSSRRGWPGTAQTRAPSGSGCCWAAPPRPRRSWSPLFDSYASVLPSVVVRKYRARDK